jgi:hypothetical protein
VARLELALRALLEFRERRRCELEERVARAVERLGGQRFERIGELAAGTRHERELLGRRALLLRGARLDRGQLLARLAAEDPRRGEPGGDAGYYKECFNHGRALRSTGAPTA